MYDNITFPLELDGAPVDKDYIRELLRTLHIEDKQEMLPSMLSGGEQQRVAIIRALATRPAIILADEPTGNLDTAASHDVIGLLKVLSWQYQQTVIVITRQRHRADGRPDRPDRGRKNSGRKTGRRSPRQRDNRRRSTNRTAR